MAECARDLFSRIERVSTIRRTHEELKSQMYALGIACAEVGLRHRARELFTAILARDLRYEDVAERLETLNRAAPAAPLPDTAPVEVPTAAPVIPEERRVVPETGSAAVPPLAPTGLVTMMFTDMQGFTAMTQRLGDRQGREVLLTHNRLLREQVQAHGGYEEDSQGDGFFLVFQSCRQAVNCAISLQHVLRAYNLEHPDIPINVRCGLSVGEPLQKDEHGGYYGHALIQGARISAKANGGQIFVSDLVYAMLLPSGDYAFRDIGEFELKGLADTHTIYEVVWGDTPVDGDA